MRKCIICGEIIAKGEDCCGRCGKVLYKDAVQLEINGKYKMYDVYVMENHLAFYSQDTRIFGSALGGSAGGLVGALVGSAIDMAVDSAKKNRSVIYRYENIREVAAPPENSKSSLFQMKKDNTISIYMDGGECLKMVAIRKNIPKLCDAINGRLAAWR